MKLGKIAKYYALVTQAIITIVVLLFIGYFIGTKIDDESFWPGLLAALFSISGLISFIGILLRMLKQEDRKKDGS